MVRFVRGAVLLAAVVALALPLAACADSDSASAASSSPSSSAAADSFVGTWRMDSGDHVRWVISANGSQYAVVQGTPGKLDYVPLAVFDRAGDRLTGSAQVSGDGLDTFELTLGTDSRRIALVWTSPSLDGPFHTTLTKVSDSTATPTPVP